MERLSDEQLAALTPKFKYRLAKGETLEDLLPEAFAAICEADYRILGKKPYDVQILGAIALHYGYLAEMNTGEGKTLVATMPLYLNALTGKSTILVTTNGYLVVRDAEEMGQVYNFMGMSVATGTREDDEQLTNDEKKIIYSADIVYTTHGAVGFDYLFNNLVVTAEDRFMREFNYIIIDEADSVLLDSASTPLVISGSPRVQSNLYDMADFFVTTLMEDEDYIREDKDVWFTEEGIARAEKYFQIDNFYAAEHFELNRHVFLALKAHVIMEMEKDYVIAKDGELFLLDNGSGRMMPGVKIRGGLHQAIEVKEGVEPSQETRSMASITFQNLFRMFPKMAGMSGTISNAADELYDVYGKETVIIPPNKPLRREDRPDLYFKDIESQYLEAIENAIQVHKTGQPVLIVAGTIHDTEMISRVLIEENVPHNVLNANNAYWEASIIKEAGQKGAVTVATSMAGRGTDIKLGEGVDLLGGLAVIGIGRLDNVRLERQARGRAGRQGDPGFSRFYVSLEDEVVKKTNPKVQKRYIEEGKRISDRKLKRLINSAQKTNEESGISARQHATDYDQVLRVQRKLMYDTRNDLLDGGTLAVSVIIDIARNNIHDFLGQNKEVSRSALTRYILDNLSYQLDDNIPDTILGKTRKEAVENYLVAYVRRGLKEQQRKLKTKANMDEFVRLVTLKAIDQAWIEQVDYLQQLQSAISGRASTQRDMLHEYQNEAYSSYHKMVDKIHGDIVRFILLSTVSLDEEGAVQYVLP